MNTAIVNIEMQTSDIPALKDFLKKFKTSSIKIEEKDPTKMSKEEFKAMLDNAEKTKSETEINTYSKDFADKIRQARKERKRGETIKISSENLWEVVK